MEPQEHSTKITEAKYKKYWLEMRVVQVTVLELFYNFSQEH